MGYQYRTDVKKQRKNLKQSYRSGNTPEVCVKRLSGKSCKYCAAVENLYAMSDVEEDPKKEKILRNKASKCRARSTFYMNIVDLKEPKKGMRLYGCGIENWRTLMDFLPEDVDDDEGEDFTNPEEMVPIVLTRHGKGLATEYTIKTSKKTLNGTKLLKKLHKLHNILDILAETDNDDLVWVPKDGKNKILIFPPWGKEAGGDFFKEIPYHWSVSLLEGTPSIGEDAELTEGGDEDVPLFEDDDDNTNLTEGDEPEDVEDDDVPF